PGDVFSIAFAADSATALVVASRGAVVVGTKTGDCLRFVPAISHRAARRAIFMPRASLIATLDAEGTLRAIDLADGQERWRASVGARAIFEPGVLAPDRLVVRVAASRTVIAPDGAKLGQVTAPPAPDWAATMAPDGRSILFVAPDKHRVIV